MNPLDIYNYEPMNKENLNRAAKIFVWFVEYFVRIIGAIYISAILLLVSILPFRSASKSFFRIIGTVADMYRNKHMSDEYGKAKDKEKMSLTKNNCAYHNKEGVINCPQCYEDLGEAYLTDYKERFIGEIENLITPSKLKEKYDYKLLVDIKKLIDGK